MRSFKYFAIILFFLACSPPNHKGEPNSNNINLHDTIESKPLREVGELILANKINPTDDKYTFRLLGTISNCKIKDLDFYLDVFDNIMSKSDGALAEGIGSYVIEFIKKRPDDFIKHLVNIDTTKIKLWGHFSGEEIYFDCEKETIETCCENFLKSIKFPTTNNKIDFFKKSVIEGAKRMAD